MCRPGHRVRLMTAFSLLPLRIIPLRIRIRVRVALGLYKWFMFGQQNVLLEDSYRKCIVMYRLTA